MTDVQVLKCTDSYIPREEAHVVIVTTPEDSTEIARQLLARYTGAPVSAIENPRYEHGRKFAKVSGADPLSVPDFSVSHAAGFTCVAITPSGRIGVDMELMKPDVDLGIAQLALTGEEQRSLFSLPPGDQPGAFYHFWTAKEAFLKAIGRGIGFGLQQIQIARSADGSFALASVHCSRAAAAGWTLRYETIRIDDQPLLIAMIYG